MKLIWIKFAVKLLLSFDQVCSNFFLIKFGLKLLLIKFAVISAYCKHVQDLVGSVFFR